MGTIQQLHLQNLLVMKLSSSFSAALLGLASALCYVSLNAASLGLFAAAASSLILLGVARDYAPRRAYWEPRATVVRFPSKPASSLVRLAA